MPCAWEEKFPQAFEKRHQSQSSYSSQLNLYYLVCSQKCRAPPAVPGAPFTAVTTSEGMCLGELFLDWAMQSFLSLLANCLVLCLWYLQSADKIPLLAVLPACLRCHSLVLCFLSFRAFDVFSHIRKFRKTAQEAG